MGTKHSKPVSDDEITMFLHLAKKGLTRREISDVTGRSTRTLDRYLPQKVAPRQPFDRAKHLAAYRAGQVEKETERGARHARHLQQVSAANDGYGFAVVTEPLLSRLYSLENAPPQVREFWRAA